ncbi:MAG TPA: type II 3-dehydroquinate dehydratase [Zeimonas sp.]
MTTSSKLLWALHGPNLNLLGTREPEVYGSTRLDEIDADLAKLCSDHGHRFESYQSNHEGELVDRVQQARERRVAFLVVNPAAFTHTSVALRDALAAVAIPFIEVHLSNIHRREAFRRRSYFSDLAAGVVMGLGPLGYRLAMQAAIESLRASAPDRVADSRATGRPRKG